MARKPKLVVVNDLLLSRKKQELLDMIILRQLRQVLVLRSMVSRK
jgi:hypothetical protein